MAKTTQTEFRSSHEQLTKIDSTAAETEKAVARTTKLKNPEHEVVCRGLFGRGF